MKKFFEGPLKIFKRIKNIERHLAISQWKMDDIYALNILKPLLVGRPYLPLNGGALRPIVIAYVLNEILINKRSNILEFGAGINTLLIARLIQQNNLDLKIYTIDHNLSWINQLKAQLKNEGLLNTVNFVYSPLENLSGERFSRWYNELVISQDITDEKFDLVIVDGPPANLPGIEFSRFPAANFFKSRLQEDHCVVVDDINRRGEKMLVAEIEKLYPQSRNNYISSTFFVSHSNYDLFDPIPIHYEI